MQQARQQARQQVQQLVQQLVQQVRPTEAVDVATPPFPLATQNTNRTTTNGESLPL